MILTTAKAPFSGAFFLIQKRFNRLFLMFEKNKFAVVIYLIFC